MMNSKVFVDHFKSAVYANDVVEMARIVEWIQSDARTDLQARSTALLERARAAETQCLELLERAALLEVELADIKRAFFIPTGSR